MVSKKIVSGLIIIGVGIFLAFFGTIYYQYAISGCIYLSASGATALQIEQATINMILTSIMTMAGVLAAMLGVGLIIYTKND